MFTQKISMDCTKEQYEKYLKDELLKMGYKEDWIFVWERRDNQFIRIDGKNVGTIHIDNLEQHYTYLGSFNAPLFLALAAMTDKAEGNYGEYVVGLKTGRFYRMKGDEWILPEHKHIRKATKYEIMAKLGTHEYKIGDYLTLTTRGGHKYMGILKYPLAKDNDDGFIFYAAINALKELHLHSCFGYWSEDTIRHSTKEEIEEIDKRLAEKGRYFDKKRLEIRPLSEKKCNHNTLENKLDQLNKKGQVEVNTPFDATEFDGERIREYIDQVFSRSIDESDAINLLKSKGYKILKPKTWEEI